MKHYVKIEIPISSSSGMTYNMLGEFIFDEIGKKTYKQLGSGIHIVNYKITVTLSR